MPPKNIIVNSLKESFILIRKNKVLFVLLFALQIIFFVIFSFINLSYQTKILESAKAITDYMSQQQLDEASVASSILEQKSILGDDPLSISRNFKDIVKNFRLYLFYLFLLLIFFTSLNWSVTNKLIHKNNFKQLTRNFFNNLIVLLFYFGLIFAFFFSLINISISQIAAEGTKFLAKYYVFLLFSAVLAYFMFVSIALLHKIELKNIVQKTLGIGLKKMHYVLAVYFINIFLFAVSIFLLYYFIEKNLFILLLSIILMIFIFVFGRIFMVNVVEKLEKI